MASMVMKLLNRLIDRYVPMPAVLAAALRAGTVRIPKSERGERAYVIAPHCRDAEAVKKAIAKRNTWELAAAVAVSATVVTVVVAVVQQATR
jgi:ABC-type spermidine/putrescine transport system permease subunit I